MSDERKAHIETEVPTLHFRREPYLKWRRHQQSAPPDRQHQATGIDHDELELALARIRAREIRQQEQAEERRRTIASASLRDLVRMAKQDLARLSAKRRAEVLAEPKGAASPK